jgi:hypothetical protein
MYFARFGLLYQEKSGNPGDHKVLDKKGPKIFFAWNKLIKLV